MKLIDFMTQFSDEETCKQHFKTYRERQGIVCKKCTGKEHRWLVGKSQFECKTCGFRTTLKSGTIMENSRLSYQTYFQIMFLMTNTKKGVSAKEMQRQLSHKRYMTIWTIMHRIRALMGKRDDRYKLKDMVEFDEGFFETSVPQYVKGKLKAGKGSQRQVNIAVMAESTPLIHPDTNEEERSCRYFKMKVLGSHTSESVEDTIKENLDPKTVVFTDKSKSYSKIEKYVEAHISVESGKETTIKTLKWVHIAISNAKRNLLGVYHGVSSQYLQNYLNEFVYKINRRYLDSTFERLALIAVINQSVN